MKTPQQIVDACNELARTFCGMHGYRVPADHKFYEGITSRDIGFWTLAVAAYDHIEGTDVDDALNQVEEA